MTTPNPWWVIHEDDLLNALQRTHNGEPPDLVFTELYANSHGPDDDNDTEDTAP